MRSMDEYPDLDKVVPVNFFSALKIPSSSLSPSSSCLHLGFLVKDGFNYVNGNQIQRVRCSNCGKRFGIDIRIQDLQFYQMQMQRLVYNLFFAHNRQKEMESRWHIPQTKLSRFKRQFVAQLLHNYPDLFQTNTKHLPKNVMFADETFFGTMGNSNTQIVFTNDNFEVLAAGPAQPQQLQPSILGVFNSIPKSCRDRLRVLVTDGEPAYKSILLQTGGKVMLIQQLHAKPLLGSVIFNKYVKFGPHFLHYEILTHWKIFTQKSQEICFHWNIRLVKGQIQAGRGGPTIQLKNSKKYQIWRQKLQQYSSAQFKKKGHAKVFINLNTKKISKRAGAEQWMIRMFQAAFKIFQGKCITNNRSESKHSQVKRNGAQRKQQDLNYSDDLFRVCASIAEQKKFPPMVFEGHPLFKYIIQSRKYQEKGYVIQKNGAKITQTVLPMYTQ